MSQLMNLSGENPNLCKVGDEISFKSREADLWLSG